VNDDKQGHHLSEKAGKPGRSGNLTDVREMSGILLKIRDCQGKNLFRELWHKTVYSKLHICIHTAI